MAKNAKPVALTRWREGQGNAILGEGCLCMGNLMTADKKTAPNVFHSEPFFRFGINF
jgi:hypothetical protein